MQSHCDDSDRKKSHQRFGHRVRFVAQNNETYQIDLSRCSSTISGLARFVQSAAKARQCGTLTRTRRGAGVPRWLPYARPLQRVLEAAYADREKDLLPIRVSSVQDTLQWSRPSPDPRKQRPGHVAVVSRREGHDSISFGHACS